MDALRPRHLRMQHPAAGGHELDVAGVQLAVGAGVVLVDHLAFEDEGHRLHAPVRMGGEAGRRGEPVLGQEQEGAVGAMLARRDHQAVLMARPDRLAGTGGFDAVDGERHGIRPLERVPISGNRLSDETRVDKESRAAI